MRKYRCRPCGYIYDPAVGDPDNGVPPGTPFDRLPGDWVCPVCGAPRSAFEPADRQNHGSRRAVQRRALWPR